MAPDTKPGTVVRSRLYCPVALGPDQPLMITGGPHHHLHTVLRVRAGDEVHIFNGHDGEWRATIKATGSGQTELRTLSRTRIQEELPDVWLVFSPLTRQRTHYVVEKATELGIARLCPVTMTRSRPRRITPERLRQVAIGAAQQCGGLAIPEIRPIQSLATLLANWPTERQLLHCDECLAPTSPPDALARAGPKAILVGPEGGLTTDERTRMQSCAFTTPLSLGNRILRAETAVVAALALVHFLAP